jgi:hypothetical protein
MKQLVALGFRVLAGVAGEVAGLAVVVVEIVAEGVAVGAPAARQSERPRWRGRPYEKRRSLGLAW